MLNGLSHNLILHIEAPGWNVYAVKTDLQLPWVSLWISKIYLSLRSQSSFMLPEHSSEFTLEQDLWTSAEFPFDEHMLLVSRFSLEAVTEMEGYGLHFVWVIDGGSLPKMLFLNWSILGKLMKKKIMSLKNWIAAVVVDKTDIFCSWKEAINVECVRWVHFLSSALIAYKEDWLSSCLIDQ